MSLPPLCGALVPGIMFGELTPPAIAGIDNVIAETVPPITNNLTLCTKLICGP